MPTPTTFPTPDVQSSFFGQKRTKGILEFEETGCLLGTDKALVVDYYEAVAGLVDDVTFGETSVWIVGMESTEQDLPVIVFVPAKAAAQSLEIAEIDVSVSKHRCQKIPLLIRFYDDFLPLAFWIGTTVEEFKSSNSCGISLLRPDAFTLGKDLWLLLAWAFWRAGDYQPEG